ncbi:MAG: HesA/MoeB/ThiF family protein, partial [Candidatus Binatia bacterium]
MPVSSPKRWKRKRGEPSVLVVGVGGLGTAAAIELLRRGVERVGLADGDRVEVSNLHRQMLHETADIGRMKATVAAERLAAAAGASIRFVAHTEYVTGENAPAMFANYRVVIDATDNPAAKFLLNDAAVLLGKPLVHAGVVGLEGQLLTILPRESACLRCLFPLPPAEDDVASCSQAGILGPLAGIVGALEAREAVKC